MKKNIISLVTAAYIFCSTSSASSAFEITNNVIAVIPEWYQASKVLEYKTPTNNVKAALHIANPIAVHYALNYLSDQIGAHLKDTKTRRMVQWILTTFPTKIACSLLLRIFVVEPTAPKVALIYRNLTKTLF